MSNESPEPSSKCPPIDKSRWVASRAPAPFEEPPLCGEDAGPGTCPRCGEPSGACRHEQERTLSSALACVRRDLLRFGVREADVDDVLQDAVLATLKSKLAGDGIPLARLLSVRAVAGRRCSPARGALLAHWRAQRRESQVLVPLESAGQTL